MADYRTMFDSDYIYAFDLQGQDVTVTIDRVVGVTLVGEGGRKAKKPCVYFRGKDRGLALNKTNGKTIASLYGPHVEEWVGKRITLYPTTTQFGGETKDCIRVRNRVPPEPKRGTAQPDLDAPREPGSDG